MYWKLSAVCFSSFNFLGIRFEVFGYIYELSMRNRVACCRRVEGWFIWVCFDGMMLEIKLNNCHDGSRHSKEDHQASGNQINCRYQVATLDLNRALVDSWRCLKFSLPGYSVALYSTNTFLRLQVFIKRPAVVTRRWLMLDGTLYDDSWVPQA